MSLSNVIVKILGTAQDASFPQPNCYCENCQMAYKNPDIKRLAAAIAVIIPDKNKWAMIDATPDFGEQLHRVRSSYTDLEIMNSIFITHGHIGHYTGLMYLGREAISSSNLPVYVGKQMNVLLKSHVPWKQLIDLNNISTHTIRAKEVISIDEFLSVEPIEVPHRNEYSETFGYILHGPNKKLLYIPDIDRWEQLAEGLEELAKKVDYCILDSTFFSEDELAIRGRSYKEIPHPLVTHTMDILQKLVDENSIKVYLTHFNHTNPIVNPNHEVHKIIRERGFLIAEENMEIIL